MKKIVSVVLFVAGLLLLYFGYDEYHSFGSELDQAFGGSGSDQAIWMIVVGAAAAVGGLVGLMRERSV